MGAIAKGYIADKIAAYLTENGVEGAIIDLGGNIYCVGNKNGEKFNIAIRRPETGVNKNTATVKAENISIVTAGKYERYFIENGKKYHHILDTSTGYPVENEILSVSVISRSSTYADALSTACLAAGLEKGLKIANSLENTYVLFITDGYEIYYSDGFEENIEIKIEK